MFSYEEIGELQATIDELIGASAVDEMRSGKAWAKLSAQEQKAINDFLKTTGLDKVPPDPKASAEWNAKPLEQQVAELKKLAASGEINVQGDLAKLTKEIVAKSGQEVSKPNAAKEWLTAPAWDKGPARWKVGAGAAGAGVGVTILGFILKKMRVF